MWDSVYFGTISVGTAPVGLNLSFIAPSGSPPSQAVLIQIESGAIRFRIDKGGTPTAAAGGGLELFAGKSVLITSNPDLRNFLAIRRENEIVNALILVNYLR